MMRDLSLYLFGAITASALFFALGATPRSLTEVRAQRYVLTDSTGAQVLGTWSQEKFGTYLRMMAAGDSSEVPQVRVSAFDVDIESGRYRGAGIYTRHPDGQSASLSVAEVDATVSLTSPHGPRSVLGSGDPDYGSWGTLQLFQDGGSSVADLPGE